MKLRNTLIALAALATLAGCLSNGAKPEFASMDGGPLKPAVAKEANKLCKERYDGLYATEQTLYGRYGDYVAIYDDAVACMARHGVRVLGWRQKDGRLTRYQNSPKYLEY